MESLEPGLDPLYRHIWPSIASDDPRLKEE